MKEMRVRLTFTDEVLGTSSANPEIHDQFIASKAPDAPSRNEEVARLIETEGLEEAIEQKRTIFPKDDNGNPFLWDYQIKGFFKGACGMLRPVPDTKSSKCKAYKKEIDGRIFINERKIPFSLSGDMGVCQRSLRANTPQGERTSLASSETVPAGSSIEFTVRCLIDADIEMVKEWLDYGQLSGLCQWRNGGKGRFMWQEVSED